MLDEFLSPIFPKKRKAKLKKNKKKETKRKEEKN